MAIGLKSRNEPAVLAATRSDSDPVPKELFWLHSVAFVVFARFFGAGPSSPSVPSSYPDVFPPAAGVVAALDFLGRLVAARDAGRDAVFLTFPPLVNAGGAD